MSPCADGQKVTVHKDKKTFEFLVRDHPFKTSACLGGEGCPHVPMVERSHYVRIKNPLHKHFTGMPMVGGRGKKL